MHINVYSIHRQQPDSITLYLYSFAANTIRTNIKTYSASIL